MTMAHDDLSKNHKGGIKNNPTKENLARMYEAKSKTGRYKALKMYLSKINPYMLRPLPATSPWMERQK